MIKNENFEIRKEKLDKIGFLASKNVEKSLSKMIGQKIDVKLPYIAVSSLKGATNIIKDREEDVVSIYFNLTEDITGNSIVTFPMKSAKILINTLYGEKSGKEAEITGDFEKSTLMEISNVVLGSFLNTLTSLTDLLVIGSIPYITIDKLGSIFNSTIAQIGQTSQILLLIEIKFSNSRMKIGGWLYIILDTKSLEKINNSLGEHP